MNYIIIRTIAILVASYITSVGVPISFTINTGWIALLTAVVLAVINHTIKPMISIVSLPITILSLGLFSFVINGAMIYLASLIVTGFIIPSFIMAVWFAVVLSIINWVLHMFE